MKKLANQTAIITGSSSGIGQAIAIAMANAGAKICINYHSSEEGAEETQEEIEKAGAKSIIVQADTSKPEDVKKMFDKTIEAFGTVDIVVSNAGVQKDAPFLEMEYEDWKKLIDINLNGQFLCAKEAAKEFIKRGIVKDRSAAAGKIICMSSVHDVIPWGGHINYATAKAGILMFVKTLAQELGPHKIRVNALSPGAIKTDINKDVWSDEEANKKLKELIPYGRIGEPEDIGKAAVWLASDDSDYMHGQTLYIDGGMTLYPGFSDNG
ncbi:glucose 1-dehydrogenase [Fulvivirga maritima]|nr:glucose 1-dehydrogenase [Fulvivirga maritima]UII24488.1 glucose 1-dehydrogenase [Fulvivirga maritima]